MKELNNEMNIEGKLKELVKEVGGNVEPQYKKLKQLANKVGNNQKELKKTVDSLQESLDYLRVCIKYQMFDLEATRRENKYLRKMLEEREG